MLIQIISPRWTIFSTSLAIQSQHLWPTPHLFAFAEQLIGTPRNTSSKEFALPPLSRMCLKQILERVVLAMASRLLP
ncbi:hypothetical protein WG66_008378, partial [Moniliophthora roreri]